LQQLGLDEIFDYPKPVSLCKELILGATASCKNECVILDFFAGSGTTAQAVMQLNSEDGGNRKFILIQAEEPTNKESKAYKSGYKTIDQIASKRIAIAGKKILEEYDSKQFENNKKIQLNEIKDSNSWNKDIGFKRYHLATPKIKTIDKILAFDPNEDLFDSDMLKSFDYPSFNSDGVDTLLATWLLADGFTFGVKVETIFLADYRTYYIRESATIYFIDSNWNKNSLEALFDKIYKNELTINMIIVYSFSFSFKSMRELKNNIKNLPTPPTIIQRFSHKN
jgi:hypothetical protein